jgi:hypothetical protein
MSSDRLIPTVLDLLARARAAEETLIASLRPDERRATGTLENWSAKDLIAHITAWHANLVATLEAAAVEGTPPPRPNLDEANAQTFAENAQRPWDDVVADARTTAARVGELLPRFGDDDLLRPDRYPWRHGQPMAATVVLRAYWHPMSHIGPFQAQRGDRAAAEAICADLLAAAGELAWLPLLRGWTLYMAAGVYTALGDRPSALAALREGLVLAPQLRDWSQQDPALAALRSDPEYAAIYA